MEVSLRLIRTRPKVYMISNNPNVSLGNVDCWLYTCHIALKNDYHRKRMDKLAYTPVEYNYLETLAKMFISPARQNQFFQKNIFNNNPVRHIAIAMNTISAFPGSYTENPFWYQLFELRQIEILREVQPIVDFDATNICYLYAMKMKAMNFQDDIPSIPIDNFENRYKIVFDLTSMQDPTENCHFPQLVGETLRVELSFSFPLEHVIELSVLNECLRLQLTNLVLSEKNPKWIMLLSNVPKYRNLVSFPSDYVLILDNGTFANMNTQSNKMHGQHWIMTAKFRHEMYFADPLGRKKYHYLKQYSKQMIKAQLQSHSSVCSLYTINAAFHLFNLCQEEITAIQDFIVLCFISNYM